ncbi:MAG: hypothetical protein CMQ53_02715 [Gammaproteobacteria bacterium]|nr:hypothetical protein [Gammaproteobacteria bacterium]
MKDSEKISFSKEVAETLGVESAIILELYQTKKIKNEKDIDRLTESITEIAPFLEKKIIESSISKLIKYKFIDAYKNKSNFGVKFAPINTSEKIKMFPTWEPSKEAIEILNMGKIIESFYLNKLMEFRLYWIERGQQRDNWNSSFIDFIRREWAKENSSNKGLPYSIDSSWSPSNDAFDILELSEISKESASKYVMEFILYWKDNGAAFTTWNSKFIEHVKRRHLGSQNINNEEDKKHTEPGKYTKDFTTRKSDSSWAAEIKFE